VKNIPLINFLLALYLAASSPLQADTVVKARLESTSYKDAWVEVETLIGNGRVRLNFKGPWSHGALMYDRDTSQVTLVDHIHKTVLTLTQENLSALQLVGAIATIKLKSSMEGADPAARSAYFLIEQNAQAFFNGEAVLDKKDASIDGLDCDAYRTDLQGKKTREVWVADPQKAGIAAEDFESFKSLAHLAVSLTSDEWTQLGADPTNFQQSLATAGFPLQALLYVKGRPTGRFKVENISSKPLAPGVFDTPATYQSLSLMDVIKNGGVGNR
jgi:hypothetical protein